MKSNKADKIERVLDSVLNIILNSGLDSLSVTAISNEAKVSRAWVYEYLGGQHHELIQQAVQYVGTRFSMLNLPRTSSTSNEWLEDQIERLKINFNNVEGYKSIIMIYLKYKRSKCLLGTKLDEMESIYISGMSKEIQRIFKVSKDISDVVAIDIAMHKIGLMHFYMGEYQKQKDLKEQFLELLRLNLEKYILFLNKQRGFLSSFEKPPIQV